MTETRVVIATAVLVVLSIASVVAGVAVLFGLGAALITAGVVVGVSSSGAAFLLLRESTP